MALQKTRLNCVIGGMRMIGTSLVERGRRKKERGPGGARVRVCHRKGLSSKGLTTAKQAAEHTESQQRCRLRERAELIVVFVTG